jgi:hypothetical protein
MWQGVLASLAVLSGQHIIIFAIFYGIYLAIINNKFIKKIDRGNALQLTIYLFFISVITISILHYFQDKIQLIKLLKFMALSWLLWILRKANSFYQWNANNTYITFGLILVFILFENLSSGYFHKWFYTNILINSEYNWKSYYYDSALILSSLFIWPVILTCWHHKKQSYYMGAIVAMLFITLIYSSADAALMAFGIGLLVAFIIYKIPYTDYLYYYGFFSFI